MVIRLNGWQRLWVLVSGLYLVGVIAFVASEFPQLEQVQSLALLQKLSPASQALLVHEDKGGWGTDVDMPNGITLSFKRGVSENDAKAVAKEYWEIVSAVSNQRRLSLVGFATLAWFVPCLVLYIIGWALGWVYRGFQGKKDSAV